jgi:hypothetical protein
MPVVSSYRRITASTKTNQDRDKYARNRGESGIIGKNEIDNHADTICAGANWTVLEFTGEYCNVSPFPRNMHRWSAVNQYSTCH